MFRNFLTFALVTLLTQSSAFGATIYSVTDLGTLGGTSSFGTAINDAGKAVGYSTLAGGETRAFLWTVGGGMQNLGVLGAGNSQAFDINNNDNIVGVTTNQAFRWTSPSGMVLLDGISSGSANDLNNSDAAIGQRNIIGGNRTLKWDAANATSNPFPSANSKGIAMNDLGQLVSSTSSAGFYNDGVSATFTTIGMIPTDINDSRFITGSTAGIASVLDFDNNVLSILGKLNPTDTFSTALGINSAGTIVGVSEGTGAFIADSTLTLQNLTSLLDSSFSGWTILTATDINNAGQIIGVGEFNGISHAVILNQMVPEPAGLSGYVQGMLGTYADGIIALCQADENCDVKASESGGEKAPQFEEATQESVKKVADILEQKLKSGSFKGGAKARAEEALKRLRQNP